MFLWDEMKHLIAQGEYFVEDNAEHFAILVARKLHADRLAANLAESNAALEAAHAPVTETAAQPAPAVGGTPGDAQPPVPATAPAVLEAAALAATATAAAGTDANGNPVP